MKPKPNLNLSDLQANPRNPRYSSPERLAVLGQSLARFGDLSGIVFNLKTKMLVGGHQRVESFRSEKTAKVVVSERLPKPDKVGTVAYGWVLIGGARHSYREVEWDSKTETAAMLAANNLAGEWVNAELAPLLRELQETDMIKLLGFDDEELARLIKETEPPTDFNVLDENLPVEHACPKCGYKWSGKPG